MGLRRTLVSWLHGIGVRPDVADDLALATSEVATSGLLAATPRTRVTATAILRRVRAGHQVEIELRSVGDGFLTSEARMAVAHRLADDLHVEELVAGRAVRLSRVVQIGGEG